MAGPIDPETIYTKQACIGEMLLIVFRCKDCVHN